MGDYYYAAGQKVRLEDDPEHVAIDQKAAEKAGLGARAGTDAPAATRLPNGVVLAHRSDFAAQTLKDLREAGALQPVYKHERAVLVAMPEVRIEVDNAAQKKAVMKMLAGSRLPRHTVAEDGEDRIVVRPASGNGADALKLANLIFEHAHPAAATARFLQIVPKPSLVRS